ncbi:MAG: hypothetical protein ACKVT0_04415 [Planctomycetaceae bacterium]
MQTIRTYRNADNRQAAERFALNIAVMGHGCCAASTVSHPSSRVSQVLKPASLKPEWLKTPVEPPARAWAALVIGQALSS